MKTVHSDLEDQTQVTLLTAFFFFMVLQLILSSYVTNWFLKIW